MSRATAAYGMTNQVGSSFGVALLAAFLSGSFKAHRVIPGDPSTVDGAYTAFRETFIVSGLLGVIGLAAAFLVNDRLAAHTMKSSQKEMIPMKSS